MASFEKICYSKETRKNEETIIYSENYLIRPSEYAITPTTATILLIITVTHG